MPPTLLSIARLTLALAIVAPSAVAQTDYKYGPESSRHEDVPRGKVTTHEWLDSKVFPGTVRRYYVYVPAQYDDTKPAALMVFQDGHAYVSEDGDFRAPIVFDNLIHEGAMPVTIGLFVDPGHKKDSLPKKPGWNPQPENRSFEYDSLSPAYAEFLLAELVPELRKTYKITDDPDGHAICGISSGGICAFTVAWERPDAFRKVMSHIGSFTDIRGGHVYPALVRKPPQGKDKPLRVFLQDGSSDLDNEHGNWWLGNQQLASSLAYRGYDYKFVTGDGGHDGHHGGTIFPESLRWLWRDYELPAK